MPGLNVGSLMSGLGGLSRRDQVGQVLPSQRGKYAVRDARREFFRPLVHRLVGDANALGGGGYGAPEQLNGLCFEHAPLNHSSGSAATIVFGAAAIMRTMVAYKDRLTDAMTHAGKGVHDLAAALEMTYTGAKKAMEGGKDGTSALNAKNNAKAAALCGVSPDWLATGDGEMRPAAPWPFPLVQRQRYEALDAEMRGYVQKAMNDALDYCERTLTQTAEGQTPIQPPAVKADPNVMKIPPRKPSHPRSVTNPMPRTGKAPDKAAKPKKGAA